MRRALSVHPSIPSLHSVLGRVASGLVVALALGGSGRALASGVTIAFGSPVYSANENIVLTITGTPGDFPLLLASLTPGPTVLPGIGTLYVGMPAPVIYVLDAIPASGELTLECQPDCDSPLVGRELFFQVLTFKLGMKGPSGVSNGAMLLVLSGDCGTCVHSAAPDSQWSPWPYTQALILAPLGLDFQMLSDGQFSEFSDGTAHLTGTVERASDPSARFLVDIAFGDRLVVGDPGFLPPGSPKEDLDPSAYAKHGGPVAPLLWRYYQTLDGTLTGLDGYDGGLLHVTRTGPSFQVGEGANGKNLNNGASGWMDVDIVSQPTTSTVFPAIVQADLTIDLGGCP